MRGELQLDRDGVLHGWCWDPAAPTRRVAVDIRLNGRLVTTVVAARFRTDLRDGGIGDGYHGFTVAVSKSVADGEAFVITAASSAGASHDGTMFGRVVSADIGMDARLRERLLRVAHRLDDARRAIGALPATDDGDPRLGDAIRGLGDRLLEAGGCVPPSFGDAAAAGAGTPRVTLVVAAVDARPASFRARHGCEIILIDQGGASPRALRDATAMGARVVHGRSRKPAASLDRAFTMATAPVIVLLHDDHATPATCDGLVASVHAHRTLLLGADLARLARRVRPDLAGGITIVQGDAPTGMRLAFPASARTTLAAFDPSLADTADLALLDLVLHALAAGHRLVEWREPARPLPQYAAPPGGLAAVSSPA